jgi:excisionase family DNA binding protein
MEAQELMKVSQLAPLLGVTSGRVYQLIGLGLIPSTRVGRAVRIPRAALEQWLKACSEEATRSAKEAAARSSSLRPGSMSDTDRSIAAAIQQVAGEHPPGWHGSASELLEWLQDYRTDAQGEGPSWPKDGRALAVAIRRLTAHLERHGVRVSMGHRGHRGKRLIIVTRVGNTAGAPALSASSRCKRAESAPINRNGSTPAHTGEGDAVFPRYITLYLERPPKGDASSLPEGDGIASGIGDLQEPRAEPDSEEAKR